MLQTCLTRLATVGKLELFRQHWCILSAVATTRFGKLEGSNSLEFSRKVPPPLPLPLCTMLASQDQFWLQSCEKSVFLS